jgi:DNA-binding IclR family transcriptional regulator
MTSPERVFAILDLFTSEHPVWQTDDINEVLGYSRATGYRYVKDLVDAGFLQKVTAGSYALGGRIIELDYQLRQTDPILLAAIPFMESLASRSKLDTVLSVLYAGPKVIDIYRVIGDGQLSLKFGRGRPRPVFKSGAPKVLWAGQPRTHLLKVYASHAKEIEESGLGSTWEEFRSALTAIRKRDIYFSIGELEPGIGSASVPVHNSENETVAALALVGTKKSLSKLSLEQLSDWLTDARKGIEAALALSTEQRK